MPAKSQKRLHDHQEAESTELEAGEEIVSFAQAVAELAPPAEFEESLLEALNSVQSSVAEVFGDTAYVLPFGSIVQGVHLLGSDLDLCMEVPGLVDDVSPSNGKPDNSKQVAALRRLMRKLPAVFNVIETRFWKHIKVPIVILGHTGSSGSPVETDISVGAVYEGVEKGFTDRIIRRVLSRTPRALHTARLIKLWAKVESLNKAYDGFLNALGWTLLVIYFFIDRGEVTCDVLGQEEDNERGLDGSTSLPPPLEAEEYDVPSSEEFADFFEFVAGFETWPDAEEEGGALGISIVDGTMVSVPPPEKKYADQCDFFLEDPGIRMSTERSENVARSLKKNPWQTTIAKCRDVADTLRGAFVTDVDEWMSSLTKKAASQAKAAAKPKPAWSDQKKRPWEQAEQQLPAAKRQRGLQQQDVWAAAMAIQQRWNGGGGWQNGAGQQGWNTPQQAGRYGGGWGWKR